MRSRRISRPRLARRDVSEGSGLRRKSGPGANTEMPADPGLTSEYRSVADRHGSRDPDLRHHQTFLANAHVVGDVHQIVDFGAVADDGVVDAATVDCSIGTNLDIVADDTAAHMGNLLVGSIAKDVTESVAADARTGVNEHSLPQRRAGINRNARPEARTIANPDAVADDTVRPNHHTVAQRCAASNDCVLAN